MEVRFQICCCLLERWMGVMNLDIPTKNIYDAFLMIYLSIFVAAVIVVVVVIVAVLLQRTRSEILKGSNSVTL